MISGKKRLVYRAPSTLGPISRQSVRVGAYGTSSPELKFVDNVNNANLAGSSAFVAPSATTLLNGLVPGSTASQRIGRKILMTSLYIRWSFRMAPTATQGAPLRVVVVYDKQANAAAPAVTDIFTVDDFLSPNNLSNRDRFVTLCDEITEPIGTTGVAYQVAGTIYKKINLETMFNAGTAGTIADITSGSVYLVFAQGGQIATASPNFSWYSRIRYSDN